MERTDVENLLDELNGRLTAVQVKYPESALYVQSLRKHVAFALENPEKAKYGELIKKSRDWLHEQSWKHPIFRPDFMTMVQKIDEFECRHSSS